MWFLIRVVINTLAILFASYTVPGIAVDNVVSALGAGLALGVINALVKPVLAFFTFDTSNPASIRRCIDAARDNLRALRHRVSTELWLELNTLHLDALAWTPDRLQDGDVFDFFHKAHRKNAQLLADREPRAARPGDWAMVVTTIRPDTVFIPYHWAGEKSVNRLTVAAQDPISKIPQYKVCGCRVRRAEAAPAYVARLEAQQ